MSILILGAHDDPQVMHVEKLLRIRGYQTFIFDGRLFPSENRITFDLVKNKCTLVVDNETLPVDEIQSVYWHSFIPPHPIVNNPSSLQSTRQNCLSALNIFMHQSHIKWVNGIDAIRYHQSKPLQLLHAKNLGANVPATIVTNDNEKKRRFVNTYSHSIAKPVYGGELAQLISTIDTRADLQICSQSDNPITLQRYIGGTNIRTYVCGKTCFSAELLSKHVDFRSDNSVKASNHQLPYLIEQLAILLSEQMDMYWSAIDWRLDKEGQYWFLEINPAPYFLRFQHETGQAIDQMLVAELTQTNAMDRHPRMTANIAGQAHIS